MKINCYLSLFHYLKHLYYEKTGRPDIQTNPIHDHASTADDYQYCDISDIRIHGRSLHYVFKVGDRKKTIRFYRDILGMKILRHEEQNSGDSNTDDNRWSKTMVGYGPEEDHFAFELTYNYPVHNYLKGNDFIGVTIRSRESLIRAKLHNWPILNGNVLEAPGGYKFFILDEPQPLDEDPVVKITLASSNVKTSLHYWHGLLGLVLFEKDKQQKKIIVGFKTRDVKLELKEIDQKINRAEAYGRIVYSCPNYQQPEIAKRVADAQQTILVPLVSFVRPGKPSVRLIILADPDGHEVCFVEDLAFRQISHYSPDDEMLLNNYLLKDAERDHAIGEPSKQAEYRLIEQSVKKAEYKSDLIRKNVSISLQSEVSYGCYFNDGSQCESSSVFDKTSTVSLTGSLLTESTTSTDMTTSKSRSRSLRSNKKLSDDSTAKNTNDQVTTNVSKPRVLAIEEGKPAPIEEEEEEANSKEKLTDKGNVKEQKRKVSTTKMLRFQNERENGNGVSKQAEEGVNQLPEKKTSSKDLTRKSSLKVIQHASLNSIQSRNTQQKDNFRSTRDIEAAFQLVVTTRLEETVQRAVTTNIEEALKKVVSDKLQDAVSKAVSEKVMESVTKAVARIESSMFKAVSENSYPLRGLCDVNYPSAQFVSLMENAQSSNFKNTEMTRLYDSKGNDLPSFLTLVDLSPEIRPEDVVPNMFKMNSLAGVSENLKDKKKNSKAKADSTKVCTRTPARSVRSNSKTQARKL